MKNYKNYLIAILTGLLVLMITTQPSIGAGTSPAAKAIEYDQCLTRWTMTNGAIEYFDAHIKQCAKYKP